MTTIHRLTVTGLLILAAASASACRSNRQSAGLNPALPDDFRIVARAPLVIPPEFALRPPLPGEPRPQELVPELAARAAVLTPAPDPTASAAERVLVQRAGGDQANVRIKEIIDDEQGDLAHKQRSFANLVMFWREGQAVVPTPAPDDTSAPIDPAAEAQRITQMTGNQAVIIQRNAPEAPSSGFKLPGL